MEQYESIGIKAEFTLNITRQDFAQLADRIHNEGLGDWCVITPIKKSNTTSSFPIGLVDIETNTSYKVGLRDIKRAVQSAWLDFPHALDTQAGYNLDIEKLSSQDIDEIIQVAVFKQIKYAWAWR